MSSEPKPEDLTQTAIAAELLLDPVIEEFFCNTDKNHPFIQALIKIYSQRSLIKDAPE